MGGTIVRMVLARALVVAASLVSLEGAWSTSAVATMLKPTISGFAEAPTFVSGPSGYVQLSAETTGATACTFMSMAPGTTFSPANISCSSRQVASPLFVPQDVGRIPTKVRVVLSATGPGGTRSASLTVVVKPDAGGRSLRGAPASVVAIASDRSATVTVSKPASDGGSPVTSYAVKAIDVTSPTNGGQTVSGSSTSLVIGGLINGDAYRLMSCRHPTSR